MELLFADSMIYVMLKIFFPFPCFIKGADPFGFATFTRPWDDGSNSMDNARRRLRAAFEFFTKLGVKYWTFHDRFATFNFCKSSGGMGGGGGG